jgi:hypothetical protein
MASALWLQVSPILTCASSPSRGYMLLTLSARIDRHARTEKGQQTCIAFLISTSKHKLQSELENPCSCPGAYSGGRACRRLIAGDLAIGAAHR